MSDQDRYAIAVQSLDTNGYDVASDSPGYLVRSRDDLRDVSHARHLADLIDLAELVEWRAQRAPIHAARVLMPLGA